MATLDRPILPPFLYRYRRITDDTIKREIASIKGASLWLAPYKKLNDPMEGFYEATRRLQKNSEYKKIVDGIFDAKQALGICCFSDTKDSELMWTHYAIDYTGICVAYRPTQLVRGLPPDVHAVRLEYGYGPPSINQSDAAHATSAAIKILSHKKASWAYEREWRLLGRLGQIVIGSKGCVREVYFGSRISPDHKSQFMRELAKTPVRISEMLVSGYEHKFSLLKKLK